MNTIVDLRDYDSVTSVKIEKSPYRSIIYCFSGKPTLDFGEKTMGLDAENYCICRSDSEIDITAAENFSITVARIKDVALPFFSSETFSDENGGAVAFCLNRARECFLDNDSKTQPVLDALGNLIVCYTAFSYGKNGKVGLCEKIKNALTENHQNSSFEISTYLKTLPLSEDYLKRMFKKQYGVTPHDFLVKIRLERAKMMLSSVNRFDYTIKSVALSCGFNDPLYFSRLFKKRFNMSPLAYLHRFDKPSAKKKIPVGGVFEDDV